VEVHEPADKKVKLPIVVIVEPHGAGGPSSGRKPGFTGHIGKGAVSIVAIEDEAVVLREEKVGKSVAVVIANCDAHPITAARDSGFLGHVGKGAIPIVAIERVAKGR